MPRHDLCEDERDAVAPVAFRFHQGNGFECMVHINEVGVRHGLRHPDVADRFEELLVRRLADDDRGLLAPVDELVLPGRHVVAMRVDRLAMQLQALGLGIPRDLPGVLPVLQEPVDVPS